MMTIPPQFARFFPNGLEDADWEELRKSPDFALQEWLRSQGVDVHQKAAEAAAKREMRPGLEGNLATAQKEFSDAPGLALSSTIEDTKRAGNYGESPQAKASMEYEAGRRAKGIQTASQARINELKKQLGYPA